MVKYNRKPDWGLLGVMIILITLGILILTSISASLSFERFGNSYYYLKHQFLIGILPGIILGFLVYFIPLDFFKKNIIFFLLINFFLLGLVFFPKIGVSLGGANRWIKIGSIFIQPSEFMKITFLIYLASWLATRTSPQKEWNRTLTAFLIIIAVLSIFLIFQPDIGTLGIIIAFSVIIYFLSDTPVWHSALIILMGIVALIVIVKFTPYRAARILVFLNPDADPMGMGYQIKQALIAVGSGGVSGLGLGMSQQKFGFLPQTMSDSIFAIFAEETGFIGCIILILLFLFFIWRGFKIMKRSEDKFQKILAAGIISWISIQAFINIGSMIGLLPLTGVPLPFISYGGSHLLTEFIGVGLLLHVSKNSN
jgi:cell division protein FtsW